MQCTPCAQRTAKKSCADVGCGCLQVAKFNGVHSLDLHFPSNYGADTSCITFIGIKVGTPAPCAGRNWLQ